MFKTYKTLSTYKKLTKNTESISDVPQIVVLGGENSGKSTLLNAIVGIEIFTKAKDICTTCPV